VYSAFARKRLWPELTIAVILTATVLLLRNEGRLWICSCGRLSLWAGDICSSNSSQQFLDPYSFTHLLHGFAFCGLLALLIPKVPLRWRLCLAILLEALWEITENSAYVIQRYREVTAALGYQGDTVVNSLGDIASCTVGFMLAYKLGLRRALVLFVAVEVVLLIWIRDSLLLEIIMLLRPISAIKAWQLCPNF
jgi:hypothetical protein